MHLCIFIFLCEDWFASAKVSKEGSGSGCALKTIRVAHQLSQTKTDKDRQRQTKTDKDRHRQTLQN